MKKPLFLFRLKNNLDFFGHRKTDSLTGLSNKKHIRMNFEGVNSVYNMYVCLAYIAFDAKRIKDRCGDLWVENLQKGAAEILSQSCKDYDCAARISDGVFAVSLCCKDGLEAEQRIKQITDKLNKYEHQILFEIVSPFRAGLYLPEKNRSNFETAMSNAEIGYKYALDKNVDSFICTRDILVKEASKTRLKEKLSKAIDEKQFDMYLQFVYNVKKNRFVGAEVLSRWNNPDDGLLLPAYYINNMRNTGVIEKFDMYMLEKTCRLLDEWSKSEFSDLMLSCNITRITISSVKFVENLKKIIKKYNFNHANLILEITEDALIDNERVALGNITECKNIGIKIAIDDFGAGHSSFSDISDYPVDQIKIDREIINKSDTQKGNSLLHGIINLAHDLGIETVCEGVETDEQKNTAIDNNCDYIQGYLYSYVFNVDEGKRFYLNKVGGCTV